MRARWWNGSGNCQGGVGESGVWQGGFRDSVNWVLIKWHIEQCKEMKGVDRHSPVIPVWLQSVQLANSALYWRQRRKATCIKVTSAEIMDRRGPLPEVCATSLR